MIPAVIQALGLMANILRYLVIFQFVLYLLLTYNVVSIHNKYVGALWETANSLLEPILRPIRRRMPDTGVLDLSPMVLLFLIWFVQIVLGNLHDRYVGM